MAKLLPPPQACTPMGSATLCAVIVLLCALCGASAEFGVAFNSVKMGGNWTTFCSGFATPEVPEVTLFGTTVDYANWEASELWHISVPEMVFTKIHTFDHNLANIVTMSSTTLYGFTTEWDDCSACLLRVDLTYNSDSTYIEAVNVTNLGTPSGVTYIPAALAVYDADTIYYIDEDDDDLYSLTLSTMTATEVYDTSLGTWAHSLNFFGDKLVLIEPTEIFLLADNLAFEETEFDTDGMDDCGTDSSDAFVRGSGPIQLPSGEYRLFGVSNLWDDYRSLVYTQVDVSGTASSYLTKYYLSSPVIYLHYVTLALVDSTFTSSTRTTSTTTTTTSTTSTTTTATTSSTTSATTTSTISTSTISNTSTSTSATTTSTTRTSTSNTITSNTITSSTTTTVTTTTTTLHEIVTLCCIADVNTNDPDKLVASLTNDTDEWKELISASFASISDAFDVSEVEAHWGGWSSPSEMSSTCLASGLGGRRLSLDTTLAISIQLPKKDADDANITIDFISDALEEEFMESLVSGMNASASMRQLGIVITGIVPQVSMTVTLSDPSQSTSTTTTKTTTPAIQETSSGMSVLTLVVVLVCLCIASGCLALALLKLRSHFDSGAQPNSGSAEQVEAGPANDNKSNNVQLDEPNELTV